MSDKMLEALEQARITLRYGCAAGAPMVEATIDAIEAALAQAEQHGEVVASEWRKRFGENPLSSTRRSECDEYTWRLMVLCQEMIAALERAAATPAPVEQRGEVADQFCKHCGYDHSAGPLCHTLKSAEIGPCGKSPCPIGMVCKSPFCRQDAPPAPAVPDVSA